MLVWGSTNNPLIDILLYFHYLSAWYLTDSVRINSVLSLTSGTLRVNEHPYSDKCPYWVIILIQHSYSNSVVHSWSTCLKPNYRNNSLFLSLSTIKFYVHMSAHFLQMNDLILKFCNNGLASLTSRIQGQLVRFQFFLILFK